MITFDAYRLLYHPNVTDQTEINHLQVEFEENISLLTKLDKDGVYSIDDLKKILFGNLIRSQTTFYRRRRGIIRLASIYGYNAEMINKINKISFEDIFNDEPFANEYFADLDDLFGEINLIQKMNPDYNRVGSKAATGLLWSGLTFADLTRLLDSQLILNKCQLQVDDYVIELDSKVVRAVEDYMDWRKGGGGYLFTGSNGTKAHRTTINKMISGLNGYTNRKFLSKNITYSGWFYRIYHGVTRKDFKSKDLEIKYNLWVSEFNKETD